MHKLKTTTKHRVSDGLRKELTLLRSAVTSLIGGDSEGEYRSDFVADVLNTVSEPVTEEFTSPEAFLKKLRSV